jgi:acetyltransferase-like isoleucine patch superfamily enzyme
MVKGIPRRVFNRIIHTIARFSPGATNIRPFLHKLRGVNINGDVFIAEEVYIGNEYPECVEIHDAASISVRATIMAHFHDPGKVIISKKAFIGPHCLIVAHGGQTLTIGEGSAVALGSVVTKSVPPYTFVSGVPAKPIAMVTVPISKITTYEEFNYGLRLLD